MSSVELTPLLQGEARSWRRFLPSSTIFWCALTYSLASLFVFTPLSSFLAGTGSKHVVATSSVYFHPGRSVGQMIQAVIYVSIMLAYSLALALFSQIVAQALFACGLPEVNYCVMLVLFCGCGLGFVGFIKIRVGHPSFNTACSVAIIFLVTVILREDDGQSGALSFSQIFSFFLMSCIGSSIAAIVCVVGNRNYDTDTLVKEIADILDLQCELFEALFEEFTYGSLRGDLAELKTEARTKLTAAKNRLRYAYLELALAGKLQVYERLEFKVQCMERQALHLGGINHCIEVKSQLLAYKGGARRRFSMAGDAGLGEVDEDEIGIQKFLKWMSWPMKNLVEAIKTVHNLDSSLESYSQILTQKMRHVYSDVKLESTTAESLLATSGMFAHLLKYLGEEVLCRESLEPLPDSQSRNWSWIFKNWRSWGSRSTVLADASPFLAITEALYPTRQAKGIGGVGLTVWSFIKFLQRRDVQHGIRCGVGTIIISWPAFLEQTRPIFKLWHGEWAVITYMIIIARNLGAMRKNIPYRVFGTATGAVLGILVYMIFGNDEKSLVFVGFLIALSCFPSILASSKPPAGRFVLLTYNLVCLYSYSVSHNDYDDDDPDRGNPVYDVAFHRFLSVLAGITWAVFVTLTIWPHSARRLLRDNLSVQWMRLGMVWKSDPIQMRGMCGESELQNMMMDLRTLLAQSPAEFRLRGKFESEPYAGLVKNTQKILDAFHSISILTFDEPNTLGEQSLISDTSLERKEIGSMLFLYFYTAAASVRLGFPVPDYLPQPRDSVARFVRKLQESRSTTVPEDFVLLYSYLMVALTLSEELTEINEALRYLFGALDADLYKYI